MLGHPVALVAHLLGGDREFDSLMERDAGVATLAHGRLVDHAQLQLLAQLDPLLSRRFAKLVSGCDIFCIARYRVAGHSRLPYYNNVQIEKVAAWKR